ncbi:MAG: hypothetical protein ACRD0K_05880 [Egibacteraceae bacterium]
MTQQLLTAPPLVEAAAAVLLRLASAGEAMIIVGRDPGPASACLRDFPESVLIAPGITSRFAVADGLRIAGRRVVTVLDSRITDLTLALDADRPNVVLTTRAAHLAVARDAGFTVVQPGWPTDVEPLLRAAFDVAEPVLVRLHRRGVEVAPPLGAPRLGIHRVLWRGRDGLLVGAGPGVPALVQVTAALAARGVRVTSVEMHTIRRATGVDPVRTDSALLAGPVAVEDARQLVPIPLRSNSPDQLADAVQAALPRRPPTPN